VLAPATLAALPSTRAIPDRDVFYAWHAVALAKAGRSSRSLRSPATASKLSGRRDKSGANAERLGYYVAYEEHRQKA